MRCRLGCGQPIRFVPSVAGRKLPIDPAPNPKGNVMLERTADGRERAVVLGKQAAALHRNMGTVLYMPHHATCTYVGRLKELERASEVHFVREGNAAADCGLTTAARTTANLAEVTCELCRFVQRPRRARKTAAAAGGAP